jgi:hypothetical protein
LITGRSISKPAIGAYLFALVVALGIGYFVAGMPIQLTDSLENLGNALAPLMVLLSAGFDAARSGYLRPLLNGQIRIAVLISHGHYFVTFKTIHVAQLVACALLLVHLVRPATWPRAIASALGVAAIFGAHTFTGTVTEAFPINTFLTIVVCTLLAADLALSEPAWWRDVVVVALFAFAILTVESGALVFCAVVAARVAGARGVSRAGLAGLGLVIAGYLLVRLSAGHLAGPPLTERTSAGFGFGILDAQQLHSRFGARPWVFYAYNVACQVLTVLFAEPREGVFSGIAAATSHTLLPRQIIAVVASTGLTIAIAWFLVARRNLWMRWALERDDQVVAVFLAVLAANAVISYPYVKDVIVSTAGAFFAVAGAIAVAHLLGSLDGRRWVAALPIALLLTVVSAGWTVRTVGTGWNLRRTANLVRNEWIDLDYWKNRNGITLVPERAVLADQLQRDAIRRRVPPPSFVNLRMERYLLP